MSKSKSDLHEDNVGTEIPLEISHLTEPDAYEETPLKKCCRDTIDLLAVHNPMILCQKCQRLIKCFLNKNSFKNYIVFCKSRNRNVLVDFYDPYHVVIFKDPKPYK